MKLKVCCSLKIFSLIGLLKKISINFKESFQNDKEILLEEIAVLRREKLESDGRYQQLHDDYSQARVNLERHHQEMRQMKQQLTLFDGQVGVVFFTFTF